MKRACVIGWPIEHSRSPLIHGYWLAAHGIDGSYTKQAVRPEEARSFLAGLTAHGFVGCNVTVPHKETAFALCTHRDPSAVAVGAANTLWLENGELHGANTDTYGFMTHLTASAPRWGYRDGPICIFGAGGAARAIIYGFLKAGVGDIRVFNRSRDRADVLSRTFGPKVQVYDWSEREHQARAATVVVNTTSLGLNGVGNLGISTHGFRPDCVVADIVYVPLETGFLKGAREQGLTTVDGLGMLLHQAVPGFECWFGVRPTVTKELRAIIAADLQEAQC